MTWRKLCQGDEGIGGRMAGSAVQRSPGVDFAPFLDVLQQGMEPL